MRKAQGKNSSRPGSGMLEVVSLGSETTGDSVVAVGTPQGPSRTVSSAPGTPKKTVNLLAVKRKEESASNDLAALAVSTTVEADEFLSTMTAAKNKGVEKQSAAVHVRSDGVVSSSSSDSSEEVDSEGEDDLHTAPNEMKLEFLDCVMKKDYQNAAKLCKMILIYEPSNQDALSFQSLIAEKIEQDAVDVSAGGSSAESDSSDSQDGSDSDANEDDSDDETSTEDDEDQSDDEESDGSEGGNSSENDQDSSVEERSRLSNGTAMKCNGTSVKKR